MNDSARKLPKVEQDRRVGRKEDIASIGALLEIPDRTMRYYATVTAVSEEFMDEYTVDIYVDKQRTVVLAEDVKAFALVEDIEIELGSKVMVIYTERGIAFITDWFNFGLRFIKCNANWQPKNNFISGHPCNSAGVVQEKNENVVYNIQLYSPVNYHPPYAPYQVDDIVAYWPYDEPITMPGDTSAEGVVLNPPPLPPLGRDYSVLTAMPDDTVVFTEPRANSQADNVPI